MSSLDSDEREEQVVSHPLAGVLAKLNRAQEHLEALHSQLPAFLDRKPHRFSAELDPERRRYSMRVTIFEDPRSSGASSSVTSRTTCDPLSITSHGSS